MPVSETALPGGQAVHCSEAPGALVKVPAGQEVQLVLRRLAVALNSSTVPGMQAVQAEAPEASLVSRPVGQVVQVLAEMMEGRKVR